METDGQEPVVPAPGQVPTETPVPAETVPAPDAPTGLEALSPAELVKIVKELRRSEASTRTKMSAFEKAEEDRRVSSLSELEKARAVANAATEARTALEVKLAKRDALAALKGAHVVDPDLAYLAIRDSIEIFDGEPVNVDALVAEFVAARPQMVASAAPLIPDIKSTNPVPSNHADTSKMSPMEKLRHAYGGGK